MIFLCTRKKANHKYVKTHNSVLVLANYFKSTFLCTACCARGILSEPINLMLQVWNTKSLKWIICFIQAHTSSLILVSLFCQTSIQFHLDFFCIHKLFSAWIFNFLWFLYVDIAAEILTITLRRISLCL